MASEYEHGYDVPKWWLDELRSAMGLNAGQEKTWDRAELAARASAEHGRATPWDTSRITRLLQNRNVTLELVIAVSKAVGISPPVFEARTKAEADAMLQTSRRFDGANPESSARVSRVAQQLDAAVKGQKDQSGDVLWKDEGSPRSPRTRRASTRR